MTYIKLESDGRLVVTQRDTIYRGDNMSKGITFLIPEIYGNIDIKNSVIFLSYIRAGGDPDIVVLEHNLDRYNAAYLQFNIPVTCKLSRYPGEVVMWLQICAGNNTSPDVIKSGDCRIFINDSQNLDDCMSDHQLTILYQMKKKVDELSNEVVDDNDNEWEDITEEDSDSSGDAYWEDM